MENNLLSQAEKYTKKHRNLRLWQKVVCGLACVVVFCTTYALILPAITLGKTAYCGMEEHKHDANCYEDRLVCGYEESTGTEVTSERIHTHSSECYEEHQVLICSIEENEGHKHNDECYDAEGACICGMTEGEGGHAHGAECYDTEKVLICTIPEIAEISVETHRHVPECYEKVQICEKPEHVHQLSCYSNPEADVENREVWERSVSEVELTGVWADDVIAIAQSQIGYAESNNNYIVTDDGEMRGYTRYGAWYGNAYGDWCAMFVSFCLNYADIPQSAVPYEASCSKWVTKLSDSLYHNASGYVPEKGDMIFFDGDADHSADHIGLVAEVSEDGTRLRTIEGNSGDCVQYLSYDIDDSMILGYASLPENDDRPAIFDDAKTEQNRIDEVMALIDALPADDEVKGKLTDYETAKDETGYDDCFNQAKELCLKAYEKYNSLTEAQKAEITNIDKLMNLSWLWEEPETLIYSPLTDDSALVYELTLDDSSVTYPDEVICLRPMTVRNQEKIDYSFSVKMSTFTDKSFGEGRVKLEFVLPLTAEEAFFDLESMSWLDDSEGYEPIVNTEPRVIEGKEVLCQVLTGYKHLVSQDGGAVIPGDFTESVVVAIDNAAPGECLALQISAAMEHSVWDGICEEHQTGEKRTVTSEMFTVIVSLTEEELQKIYEQFMEEVEGLEALVKTDNNGLAAAEDLLERLKEAWRLGELSDENYMELYDRVSELLYAGTASIAEAAYGTNWMLLRDSGWFEAYSNCSDVSTYALGRAARLMPDALNTSADSSDVPPSDVQVKDRGGAVSEESDGVSVSKIISGTELENVFDITLQVQTSQKITEVTQEPDMAVVIVMDISNTMNSNFGGVTRYAAAMTAAEEFLDQFAANNALGISKVGYVAFNTDAHRIFDLQSCSSQEQANTLKNTMRTQTGSIINASGYADAHSRFTNVEAGLAMASDMLNGVSNKNKFIIFLSDGFPTTYISSGYSGYDPYDSTGRFYDHVLNKPCLYGTSYSDEASIRARNKAAAIKNSGITIFSIGVDVAGQTIQKYITQSENADGFSVVDRTGTTYEIGDASSAEAYKNWLKNSIGSGYYYDSTDSSGLSEAYHQIFTEIKHKTEEGSQADWVANDPIPLTGGSDQNVEFIGLYNKTPELAGDSLSGTSTENAENTATFDRATYAINWDLKQSGYQTISSGNTTTYTYQLVYRVRLKNEGSGFTENTVYPTNDKTTLQYRIVQDTDGRVTISEPKSIEFPIPSVHGYLGELIFKKVDTQGKALEGAQFTLRHDDRNCSICRGNGTTVEVESMTTVSGSDGNVSFDGIPSGHKYILEETRVPDGYSANGNQYYVEVAYDQVTVTVQAWDGVAEEWKGEIENHSYYELPDTGGTGTIMYTIGGLLLMTAAGGLLLCKYIKRRKEGHASF